MHLDECRRRPCPICRSERTDDLAAPSVAAVARANPGYSDELRERLAEALGPTTPLPIVRCTACSFAFAAFEPPAEILALVYGGPVSTADNEEKTRSPEKRLRRVDDWHRLLRATSSRSTVSLIDYGCGWGDFLATAASPGVRTVGLEPHQRSVARAAASGCVRIVASTTELDEDFDAFMCDQVLEHVNDPVAVARDLRSVLRTGAVGIVGVPNFGRFDWAAERRRLADGNAVSTKDINPIEHVNYFTGGHLAAILRAAGFSPLPRPALGRLDRFEQRALDRYRRLRGRPSTRVFAAAGTAS